VLLLQANPRSRILCQTPGAAEARDLSWFDWSTAADLSSDGKKLLFYEWGAGVGGNPTVYVRDTGGGDAVRLGEGRALALSPDGQWVLAVRTGTPSRLVLLPTGAGEERLLPSSGLNEYYSASWFPDGKRVLFLAGSAEGGPRSYVQNVDGGEAHTIAGDSVQAAMVSPDGKLLAAIDADRGYELLPVDGGAPRPISGALEGDEMIQWSADGRYLFVRTPGDSVVEFFRLDLSTGRREAWKRIEGIDPVGFLSIQPASVHITPDGKSIVYSYWKALTDLYLVDKLR
jgi:Tol biopolymer transport system component